MKQKQKLLVVADDPDCQSGFGRAARKILETLHPIYDVTVLGINYRGDPSTVPYPVYAAAVGGDVFGVGRLLWMCDVVKPDVIWLQNDGWNIPAYTKRLQLVEDYAKIPVVASVAVDGKNFRYQWLDNVALAIFWTDFALREAREGGYEGPATVIPLGIDLTVYGQKDRTAVRQMMPRQMREAFLVGNVNRNQPRKRWDLTVRYFAEWVRQKKVKDAWLYLHVAPTGDVVFDVKQLAKYYGVYDRLAVGETQVFYGVSDELMVDTYNCFDVQMTTTQGEGFGFTTFEGMACGIPQIVPDWSALGELCKGVAKVIPCTSTAVGEPYVSVIGGVADETAFIESLDELYHSANERGVYRERGLAYVRQLCFDWKVIGDQYRDAIENALRATETREEIWQDLGRAETV